MVIYLCIHFEFRFQDFIPEPNSTLLLLATYMPNITTYILNCYKQVVCFLYLNPQLEFPS